jgi:hypothetical protein
VVRYESPVSRVVCGIAAIAMTAITIGVAVVIPAMESDSHEPLTVAASKVAAPAVTHVTTGSSIINVVALREPRLFAVRCVSSHRKQNAHIRVRQSPSCSHAAR